MAKFRLAAGCMVETRENAHGWRYRVTFPSGISLPCRTRRAAFTGVRAFAAGLPFAARLDAMRDADVYGGKLHKGPLAMAGRLARGGK